ncbi:MAG: glutamine synthetase [Candidatus Cloacimonadota bacterium]|nr:MAG: glutamine synthetase [Candidatus Cloacimonadota bacterium]PIE78194.1 MAG: glutamine synthetase [Candidatus Delongbacteria bacterium]
MSNKEILLNPNKIVQFLKKPSEQFTKDDIIKFIVENNVKMLNFRYIGGDGRLKTLNFVLNSLEHLEEILSKGERVDGSSLFSYIDAHSSDLYVVPRFKTAFVNPFEEEMSVDILCTFFTSDGKELGSSPSALVKRAHNLLKERTGFEFQALGELEYYLFSETDNIYPIEEQKGYHESHPFSKWGSVRKDAMRVISEIGGKIKYGHAEVGNIIHKDQNGLSQQMVQQEIEFLPTSVEDAADQMVLAKWAVREIAYKYNLEVSYAPKIIVGHAGSGMHFHTRLIKGDVSVTADDKGLTDTAKKMIAGFLKYSPSLTAFGNTVPTSFLRLVPHQEAPTSICWGDRNRSVLVRVPLGWLGVEDMINKANPLEPKSQNKFINGQTVELRSPDGSANVHQLLAGMTLAAISGIEDENSLEMANKLYVAEDASKREDLDQLPASCYEAAEMLEAQRELYEKDGIFPPMMIDKLISELKAHDDKDMSEKLFGNADALQDLVNKHIHCG